MSAAESRLPTTALEYALAYAAMGWSVVPVRPGDKMPAVPWAKFQALPADLATIRGWFDADPTLGLGLVQGRNASTIVLDFDGELGHETLRALDRRGLPHSPRVLTPGGGVHVFLRHPGVPVATRKGVLPGMDVRGDGGFVVAPPSRHANGGTYHWDVDHHYEDAPLADVPAWLLPALQAPVESAPHLTEVTRAAGPLGLQGPVADGREAYMRDTVLAVLRDQRDRLGRLPTEAELIEAAWPQYARNVDFSRPGRGRDEFAAKVRYTLARAAKGQIRGFDDAPAEPPPEAGAEGQGERDTKTPLPRPPLWVDRDVWDAAAVPRRPWVVPGYLMRGAVTVLSGQGAGGKSSLVVAWTLALASGNAIGAFSPAGPARAVNYNVEDDRDEQQRRYGAALVAQKLDPAEVMPRIVRCGPHDVGTLFARDPQTGEVRPTAAMAQLERLCMETEADVLACDPLAELHNAEENDNTAMRAVIAAFRSLAQRLGIAVLILHHDRKGTNAPGEMDRMRGASAITGAVRVMLTLTTMSPEEADRCGVAPEERRRHFRVDGAKSNYAIATEAEWWKLAAYRIGNGEEIAACLPWDLPSPWDGLPMELVVSVLEAITAGRGDGQRWSPRKEARDGWAGRLLVEKAGRTDGQAATILRTWETEGVLRRTKYKDPKRREERDCYEVDADKLSEMKRVVMASGGVDAV